MNPQIIAPPLVGQTIGSMSDAFVIAEGLRDFHQDALRREVGEIGVVGRSAELADDTAPGILLVVIDIEQTIGFESRMKREAEQAFLIVSMRLARHNVQELLWLFAGRAFRDNEDAPVLFDDKEPAGSIGGFGHPNGALKGQFRKDRSQFDLWKGLRHGGSRQQY